MNLFVLWTESYGEALKVSNQLAAVGGHLLDCSVIGRWSQVLVHFENANGEKHISALKLKPGHKKAWLPSLKQSIVESYLSLSSNKVADFILSIETSFIGDIFEFLQTVDLNQYPIVDLRLLRFSQPKVLLLLTGPESHSDQLQVILENKKAQGKISFDFEVVKMIVPQVKELFHHLETN
jgi:hypothetical protein